MMGFLSTCMASTLEKPMTLATASEAVDPPSSQAQAQSEECAEGGVAARSRLRRTPRNEHLETNGSGQSQRVGERQRAWPTDPDAPAGPACRLRYGARWQTAPPDEPA